MYKAVTASEMQSLDKKAIEEYGIPSLILMENAGRGIAEFIFNLKRNGRVTIFCGKGNNGGDGLVIARHLHNRGFNVFVLLFGDPDKFKNDPAVNFQIMSKMKIPWIAVDETVTTNDLATYVQKSDIIVDALFGVGLHTAVTDIYQKAIEAINAEGKLIVAVDLPSGLNADTGEIMGSAVKATHTATLALPKKGLLTEQGSKFAGKICVVDIGIPREELIK